MMVLKKKDSLAALNAKSKLGTRFKLYLKYSKDLKIRTSGDSVPEGVKRVMVPWSGEQGVSAHHDLDLFLGSLQEPLVRLF